jgi:sugar phosphate permease
LLVPALGVLVGSLALTVLDAATPIAVLACVIAVFGLPNGMGQVANQVVVYRAAPVEQVGAAVGLSRTAQYTGAMIATSITGLAYAPGVSDTGLHVLGWVFSAVGFVLVAVTLVDRSLRRRVDPPPR